jgi:hypothetical protein
MITFASVHLYLQYVNTSTNKIYNIRTRLENMCTSVKHTLTLLFICPMSEVPLFWNIHVRMLLKNECGHIKGLLDNLCSSLFTGYTVPFLSAPFVA